MHVRRLHFHHDVARLPERAGVGDHFRACRGVIIVTKVGCGTGAGFDSYREAHLDQPRDVLWGDRDPAFARAAFFRDGELHSPVIIPTDGCTGWAIGIVPSSFNL